MTYEPTPEQLYGIEQHEKERKDRCERVLSSYEKVKVVNDEKENAKKLEEFSKADLKNKKNGETDTSITT